MILVEIWDRVGPLMYGYVESLKPSIEIAIIEPLETAGIVREDEKIPDHVQRPRTLKVYLSWVDGKAVYKPWESSDQRRTLRE